MADAGWFSVAKCFKVLVLFLVVSLSQCQTLSTACIEVKKAYAAKGFDENEVPLKAVSGEELTICPRTETCCTRDMEDKLTSLSRKEYAKQLEESYKLFKSTFSSRTKKFEEFFTELIDKAQRDLHDMFLQTYGLLYQQNSAIFTKLFTDLRNYYKGKDMNLNEVMDSFFSKLLQKMFELLNRDHEFTSDYLTCVTERMNDLKPFGEVPMKLSTQVRRAFIAARTFVQGLSIGRDVINSALEIQPSEACLKAFVRMTYCPHCRGLTSTKPCNNYCLNTMKGCLAQQADLNVPWNEYIDALNQVAVRLEGPFNIESVVDPIDVKISEAIMNFQENGETLSTKIFTGCGTPTISRQKRDTEAQKHTFDFPVSNSSKARVKPITAAGTSLDRLVRDIKEKVKTAKEFWVQMPYVICNNEQVAAAAAKEDDCWNGQDRAKYLPEVQKDGTLHQINNPEVDVDVTKVNTVISRQKTQLSLIINKLQNAYRGDDVDWIDTEIDGLTSGSGSGDMEVSGTSSGDNQVTEDDIDNIYIDNQQTTKGGHSNKVVPDKTKKPTEQTVPPRTAEDPTKNRTGGGSGKPDSRQEITRKDRNNASPPSFTFSLNVFLLIALMQVVVKRLMLSC